MGPKEPQEDTAEKEGDTNVLTQSVSLDKSAVADLNELAADSKGEEEQNNLAVVAPLVDGRLLDVARPPPDLGNRHPVQE